MKFCPECGVKLVSQKFCHECGANIAQYLNGENLSDAGSLSSFDFSHLAAEAEAQLAEQERLRDFEIVGGTLVKYVGNGGHVVVPNEITAIGSYAFDGCSALTSVELPLGLTTIDQDAFQDCTSLKSITIPENVTFIGAGAFYNCRGLESIRFCANAMHYMGESGKGRATFSFSSFLHGGSSGNQSSAGGGYSGLINNVFCNAGTNGGGITVTVGSNVTELPAGMFHSKNCKVLSVVFESGSHCSAIGESAFEGCEALRRIFLPSSITSIGDNAFSCCTSLESTVLPSGLMRMGKRAFGNCEALTSVVIPDGVSVLEEEAFIGCTSLVSVTIPEGVSVIGERAFQSCGSIASLTLPQSVTEIGTWAFWGCNKMKTVRVPRRVYGHFFSYEYVERDVIAY